MSCVTSREVAGPVGGSLGGPAGDGRLRRGPRSPEDDDVFDLVDGNGNLSAASIYDCNCNVRRPRFKDMEWGYSEDNGEYMQSRT